MLLSIIVQISAGCCIKKFRELPYKKNVKLFHNRFRNIWKPHMMIALE